MLLKRYFNKLLTWRNQ